MLLFNVDRLFKLRGIDRPFTFLVRNGFATSSASNLLRFSPLTVKIRTLERLCLILNCTPNDLFEWRDGKDGRLGEDHALNALRKEAVEDFTSIIKNLPLEKIGEVQAFLENLRDEEKPPE